jgi:hypothetical protein
MTERPIVPGSGNRLRRQYLLLLAVAGIVMPLIIIAVAALAHRFDGPALTAILGLATMIVATGFLLPAVVCGRGAVTANTIGLGLMRSSGTLAMTAQIVGLAGGVVTIAAGFLQQLFGADDGVGLGGITAIVCIFAGSTGGIVNRLSRRLTA